MEFEEYDKSVQNLLKSKEVADVLEKKRDLEKQLADMINGIEDDLGRWERRKEDAFRKYKDGQMERDEKTQTVIESDNMIMILKKQQMKYADLRIRLNSSFSL